MKSPRITASYFESFLSSPAPYPRTKNILQEILRMATHLFVEPRENTLHHHRLKITTTDHQIRHHHSSNSFHDLSNSAILSIGGRHFLCSLTSSHTATHIIIPSEACIAQKLCVPGKMDSYLKNKISLLQFSLSLLFSWNRQNALREK